MEPSVPQKAAVSESLSFQKRGSLGALLGGHLGHFSRGAGVSGALAYLGPSELQMNKNEDKTNLLN